METILYISVKTVSVVFILYKVWNMIFSKRMENFWDMLHNWARIARVRLWKYRKKRIAEKAKRERRKKIYGKDLPTDKPKPIQAETPQKAEESPPVDDPNEVMGKSNIIYYEDINAARTIPTRSIPLKEVELPVDKDINPDDVEDNFVPQKRLSQEDMKELMSSESIPDPEFSGACTFEELGNVADVLLNRTTDKEKIMDAAETLYKLQDSDIYHFYTTSISTEKQVDRLLKDNLDGAGRRLNGKQSERIAVDWNKFM